MLSDDQLNQLEAAINRSTLNELPSLLTQWIPILFSELRITRDALRNQTESFLATALPNDSSRGLGANSSGLHVGPEHHPVSEEVASVRPVANQIVSDSRGPHEVGEASPKRTRRRRNTRKSEPSAEELDALHREASVGGAVREEADAS